MSQTAKPPTHRFVVVEWLDSCGASPSWGAIKDAVVEPITCWSAGWLVAETEAAIWIVPHMHHEDSRRGVVESGVGDLTIPKVAVVRTTVIDLPRLLASAEGSG